MLMLIAALLGALLMTLLAGPLGGVAFLVLCIAVMVAWVIFRGVGNVASSFGRLLFDPAYGRNSRGDLGDLGRYNDGKRPIAGALDIEYRDGDGDETERYIEAKSLELKAGRLYLWGWCEKRQAVRSFRVDRILTLTDGETGEIVPPTTIKDWLLNRAAA